MSTLNLPVVTIGYGVRLSDSVKRQYAEAFSEASKKDRQDVVWMLLPTGTVTRREFANRQQTLRNWAIKYGYWEGRNTHPWASRAQQRVIAARQAKEIAEVREAEAKKQRIADEQKEKAKRFKKMLKAAGITATQFEALQNNAA